MIPIQITVSWETFIGIAGGIAAIVALFSYVFKMYDFVKQQKEQYSDIKSIKRENALIVESLRAGLDGLEQLGANHTVPAAKQKIDSYLISKAHELDERRSA